MKRIMSVILVLAMVLSLAACGTPAENTTAAPETTKAPAATTKAPAQTPSTASPVPMLAMSLVGCALLTVCLRKKSSAK